MNNFVHLGKYSYFGYSLWFQVTGGNWKLFSLGPRITDRLVVEVYSPSKLAGIGFVAAACTYSIELRPTLMYNGKVTGVQGGLPPPPTYHGKSPLPFSHWTGGRILWHHRREFSPDLLPALCIHWPLDTGDADQEGPCLVGPQPPAASGMLPGSLLGGILWEQRTDCPGDETSRLSLWCGFYEL